jgi:hypothetical protein
VYRSNWQIEPSIYRSIDLSIYWLDWGKRRQGDILGVMPLEDSETTEFQIACPFCGEQVEIYVEPDVIGTLVMDCEVCCQPWNVHVTRDSDYRYVDVMRGDGS